MWGAVELVRRRRPTPTFTRSVLIGIGVLVVLVAPEIGRMIDFHKFETFDPNGPGLGNLFGQVSPFEALGIWPSGDFRLAPGDGAVPAVAYYLGAAFGTVLLLYGIWALPAQARDRRPLGPLRRRARLPRRPRRRHRLHRGQGDRDRRAALRADDPAAAHPRGSVVPFFGWSEERNHGRPVPIGARGLRALPRRRGALLGAGAGQRAGRSVVLLARLSRRCDRWSRTAQP